MVRVELAPRVRWLLWIVATLDVALLAWVFSVGAWLDTSPLTSAVTLGGRHELVLGLAAAGFLMLAGLAIITDGFSSANRIQVGLTVLAGLVSVIALAGALSTLLLLATGAIVMGFVLRPLRR